MAGRTWGHITRAFGNGIGKQHFHGSKQCESHFQPGFVAENDLAGMHGRNVDDDMQGGIERFLGHGRRYLGGDICHLKGTVPQFESIPGLHGRPRGDDFEGGIQRIVGHGLRKFDRNEYHRHHISDDIESEPGLHGHTRDFDYKDGMEWYIGHGKRKVGCKHNVDTWRRAEKATPGAPKPTDCKDFRSAGMSTRDIALAEMTRDPTRRGTHQDRRHVLAVEQGRDEHELRRDQADQVTIY